MPVRAPLPEIEPATIRKGVGYKMNINLKLVSPRSLALIGSVLAITIPLSAAELSSSKPVTFSKDIAPIFQEKCNECHRPNTVAPFSMLTYQAKISPRYQPSRENASRV